MNDSFRSVSTYLREKGINNNNFMNVTLDKDLEHKQFKSLEKEYPGDILNYMRENKEKIKKECIDNPFFFFREILRVPAIGDKLIEFPLNLGTCSALYFYDKGCSFLLQTPSQTFRIGFLICLYLYEILIKGKEQTTFSSDTHAHVHELSKRMEMIFRANQEVFKILSDESAYYDLNDNLLMKEENVNDNLYIEKRNAKSFYSNKPVESSYYSNFEYGSTIELDRKPPLMFGGLACDFYAESSFNNTDNKDYELVYIIDHVLRQFDINSISFFDLDEDSLRNEMVQCKSHVIRIKFNGLDLPNTSKLEDSWRASVGIENIAKMDDNYYLKRR